MKKVLEFLQGKKTYIVAIAVAACAVLKFYGVEVHEVVWPVLGALGLGFVRAGVEKVK